MQQGILTRNAILAEIETGRVEVDPPSEKIGPNSIDLRLAPELRVYQFAELDCNRFNPTDTVWIHECGLVLYPGRLYIGSTVERTYTPFHVPMVSGRSSVGRLGIHIHVTAGLGDLGFNGQWTLEIHVVQPVRIYPHMRIAQMWLFTAVGQAAYGGRYQNQQGPTPSRFHLPEAASGVPLRIDVDAPQEMPLEIPLPGCETRIIPRKVV